MTPSRSVVPDLADYGAVPDRDTISLLGGLIRNEPLGDAARKLVAVACAEGVERGLARLLPLLRGHRDFAGMPPAIRGRVEDERRRAGLRHVLLARTAGRLGGAFMSEGITPLFLKGYALASLVYASPADRPMGDLDIAIPAGRFDDASAALDRLGFVENLDRAMALGPGRHAATYKHPQGAQIVDLHQHVLSCSRWPGADDGFWQRSIPFAEAGALTLAPEDHLLQACLHGYAHHAAQTPFRWIVDACKLIERTGAALRWDVLLEESRRQRCEGVLAATLGFLASMLGAAIPREILVDLANRPRRADDDTYFRLHGRLDAPSLSLRWRAFRASYSRHEGHRPPGPLAILRWAGQRWQTTSLGATLIESLRRLPVADADRRKQQQGARAAIETARLRKAVATKRKP